MDLSLQPLERSDADVIVTWLTGPDEVTLFGGPFLDFPLTAEALFADSGERSLYVIRDAGHPVATGYLEVQDDGAARIGRILVDQGRRGRGWGRRMVEALIARASTSPGVRTVQLRVYEQNLAARALYESLGFVDTGVRRQIAVRGQTWTSQQLSRSIS